MVTCRKLIIFYFSGTGNPRNVASWLSAVAKESGIESQVIKGRIFYVVVLLAFMTFESNFPTAFWFTGIIDSVFVFLYVAFTLACDEVSFRDLFVPMTEKTMK